MSIPKHFFTSETLQPKEIALAHAQIQKNLVAELVSIIKLAENQFDDLSLAELVDWVQKLDVESSFSPHLFSCFQQLSESLKINNIDQIRESLITLTSIKEPYLKDFEIRTFNPHDYADRVTKEFILSPDGPQTLDGECAVVEKCTISTVEILRPYINKAISVIEKYGDGVFYEFQEYVRALVLFEGSVVTGATSVRSFGNIYLRIPKKNLSEKEIISYFVEHIVHETSHLHLHVLMVHDPMILNTLEEKYEAPIRPDPRPMFGIFHATYVLTRMIRVFNLWIANDPNEIIKNREQEFQNMHKKGKKVVSEHGDLTEIGARIFDTFNV